MPKKFKIYFDYQDATKYLVVSNKDITDEAEAEVNFWERMNDAGISEVDILEIKEI